jgi:hypothetical protein
MAEEQQHGGRRAGRDEDLVDTDGHAVGAEVVFRDRLSQLEDPGAVRVAGASVLDGAVHRIAYRRRRLEIRFAEREIDDVDALPLELLRAFGHLDGEEWFDIGGAARRHRNAPPVRRRALTISHSMRGPSVSTPTLLPG